MNLLDPIGYRGDYSNMSMTDINKIISIKIMDLLDNDNRIATTDHRC